MTQNLEQHRQNFPALANKIYFNFGGQGTLPQAALETIINTHQYLQEHGPFSNKVNAWIQQRIVTIREAIANELSVSPQTITFTENVTAGCNIALWGIDWQAGDGILLADSEHPGVIAIIRAISRRFGVEVDLCPLQATLNEGDPVTTIVDRLQPKTRLVVLSHLLWNTGQVLPLKEIVAACHHKRVRVLADAAQSVGSLALNLAEIGVDFYAFTGHKWLCGPAGVGGFYVSPEAFEELQPTFVGWRSVDLGDRGQPLDWKNDGQRFEIATSAYPEYEGLGAAIALHQQWGTPKERYQKICQLSQDLWESLRQIDGVKCLKNSPPEAGLVSFQVNRNSHKQIVEKLEQQGFLLRTIANPDCIRACVHYFSLSREIEKLAAALAQIV
jgi:L-cysteine/cystine lyase